MAAIVLATLNAKFIHSALGLRYLMANLGPLQPQATLLEFDIHHRPLEVVEALLACQPQIVGLGVYIWNVQLSTEVAALLKRVRPEVTLIVGGPEVSYELEDQPIVQLADYVITGEADLKFAEVCQGLLAGQPPAQKIIGSPVPDLAQVALPYELYSDQDIAHRVLYVEASRGCPFECEFCLSSLDIPVRQFPLDRFLAALGRLLDRGARQIKFVDRTFNLNLSVSGAILDFLLARYQSGQFFHFEMVPDRLPDSLRERLARFPPGALQLELGIQTFNPEVAARIRRRQDYAKLEANLRFLRQQTGAHLHADLIVGLPGESLESVAAGFDRLVALEPQEIQVGILKRLRGTTIGRHDQAWQMRYNPNPPYDILQNSLIDFPTLQRLRRFARYWDLVWNSGNFVSTAPWLWSQPACKAAGSDVPTAAPAASASPGAGAGPESGAAGPEAVAAAQQHRPQAITGATQPSLDPADRSPFWAFLRWSDWLFKRVGRTESIALERLAQLLFEYLTTQLGRPAQAVAVALWQDWQRAGRRHMPVFLRPHLRGVELSRPQPSARLRGMRRQLRHLGLVEPQPPDNPAQQPPQSA
jgi:radical SAM superfamily enzyme YgiQ (UPF0313 family)